MSSDNTTSIKAQSDILRAMPHTKETKGKGRIKTADGQMRNCVWTDYINGKKYNRDNNNM